MKQDNKLRIDRGRKYGINTQRQYGEFYIYLSIIIIKTLIINKLSWLFII